LLTGSAVRDNHRIIMVLAGMPTMKSRIQESERLLDWAFREFGGYTLFKAGDTVDEAEVWLGTDPKVPLTLTSDAVAHDPAARAQGHEGDGVPTTSRSRRPSSRARRSARSW